MPHKQLVTSIKDFAYEFLLFGLKQAWACLFGALLLLLLIVTKYCWPTHFWLARYDFLFLAALVIQALLLAFRLESKQEAKVILLFHVTGTLMELFKTYKGSWVYPEHNFFRIASVPLFSGFMYAAVGSYIARISRIFDMRYAGYPRRFLTFLLAALIYINFFTHHYMADLRGLIFLLVGVLFSSTWVYFKPHNTYRRMPLLLGFFLVSLFIWLGENIGTFTTAWLYPHQLKTWRSVSFEKLGSWFLLMMISFVFVSIIHKPRPPKT